MSFRFQFRRGTTAERNAANPILAAGEPAVVLDSGQPAELVLGDGVTAMADLRAAVWDDDARLTAAATAVQPAALAAVADAIPTAPDDIGAATAAQGAKADTAVQPTAYDANTILAATTDNTPAALAVPAASLVGRAASGNIAALAPDAARLAIQSPWWLKAFDPIPAQLCSAAVTLQKDATVFVPFTATTDMVVTGITMVSQAATTGSPTSVRFGLYHLGSTPFVTVASPTSPPVTAWLLARTASDTSIFSVADTTYTRSFDSTGGYATSVRLVQGERYAVAYQILGGTMGTIPGPPAYRYTLPRGALTGCLMSAVSQNPPPDGFYGTLGGNVLAGSYNGAFFSQIDVNPASTQARPKRTAVIGDSIPAYSSWLGWGNAQGGAKVYYAYANSIGGATIPTVISGELAAVSTIRPEVVIFHAGVNDIGVEGPTTATMQARYTAAFDALLAIPGVTTVIVCTPPPSTSITGGKITTLSEIRAWLLALGRPGVIVADTGMAMSTGDGTTSDAAKRVDGVHPNAAGMQAMGNALDDVLATL